MIHLYHNMIFLCVFAARVHVHIISIIQDRHRCFCICVFVFYRYLCICCACACIHMLWGRIHQRGQAQEAASGMRESFTRPLDTSQIQIQIQIEKTNTNTVYVWEDMQRVPVGRRALPCSSPNSFFIDILIFEKYSTAMCQASYDLLYILIMFFGYIHAISTS